MARRKKKGHTRPLENDFDFGNPGEEALSSNRLFRLGMGLVRYFAAKDGAVAVVHTKASPSPVIQTTMGCPSRNRAKSRTRKSARDVVASPRPPNVTIHREEARPITLVPIITQKLSGPASRERRHLDVASAR